MNLSFSEVENYLVEVKQAIASGRYRIDRNTRRMDNCEFFSTYLVDEAKAKEILLSLTPMDFSEVRNNQHEGLEHELLYIFGKEVELSMRFCEGTKEVSLYIKFNKLEGNFVVVISIHEQKYPMTYYFDKYY